MVIASDRVIRAVVMVIGVAEVVVLVGVAVALFALLAPVRRGLERWFARRLPGRLRDVPRVVVLERRRDGTFGRKDRHG